MREGYHEEAQMAFGSDWTTHAELDHYFVQVHPEANGVSCDGPGGATHNVHSQSVCLFQIQPGEAYVKYR